jgi:hypothetical protein
MKKADCITWGVASSTKDHIEKQAAAFNKLRLMLVAVLKKERLQIGCGANYQTIKIFRCVFE